MGLLDNLAKTSLKIVTVGGFVAGVVKVLTSVLKIDIISAILFGFMSLLVLSVVYHESEIKSIKEKIDRLYAKSKKGAISTVTAMMIIAIILMIIYIIIKIRMGG